MHKYTDLEKAFMRDFIPGHTYKEIQEAFIKKFNWDITVGQIKRWRFGQYRFAAIPT